MQIFVLFASSCESGPLCLTPALSHFPGPGLERELRKMLCRGALSGSTDSRLPGPQGLSSVCAGALILQEPPPRHPPAPLPSLELGPGPGAPRHTEGMERKHRQFPVGGFSGRLENPAQPRPAAVGLGLVWEKRLADFTLFLYPLPFPVSRLSRLSCYSPTPHLSPPCSHIPHPEYQMACVLWGPLILLAVLCGETDTMRCEII